MCAHRQQIFHWVFIVYIVAAIMHKVELLRKYTNNCHLEIADTCADTFIYMQCSICLLIINLSVLYYTIADIPIASETFLQTLII